VELGVGLSVDRSWIALEGYFSVGERGADRIAREQRAWAGDRSPRVAADDRTVVRLGAVPNLVGRARRGARVARTLADVVMLVFKRMLVGEKEEAEGAQDADRR
jgi:hypothetical protein